MSSHEFTPDAPCFPVSEWTRYSPLEYLGEGFHGFVFKALDTTLERPVALKFLHRQDSARMSRMLEEARAQANVDHPRIAKVFEVGDVEGHPYIAMQYVDGAPLDVIAKDLPLKRLLALVADVAEGIHAAHDQGLVHRDLKANNVLVERRTDGHLDPVVVDFGHAALENGADRSDRRHDVWALSEMLYTLLGGFPSASGPSSLAMRAEADRTPRRSLRQVWPSLPVEVDAIVMKGIAPALEERYASAQALARDLRRFLAGDPVEAYPGGRLYRMRKWVVRHRLLVAGLALTLAAGGTVVASQWRLRSQTLWGLRYSQAVDEWVGVFHAAQMLPDHPLAATRSRMLAQIQDLERKIEGQGRLAQGPGQVALGRGYLALQDLDRALWHFNKAQAMGHLPPEAALAYGLCLSQAYQRDRIALEDALLPVEQAQQRLRELQRSLRDPAIHMLRQGQPGGRFHPALIDAHFAACEDRANQALEALSRAQAECPWLVEAKLLECQIRLRTVVQADSAMGEDRLKPLVDAAQKAYREGQTLARSEPAFALGEAKLLTLYRERLSNFAVVPEKTEAAREEVLQRVLKADPANLEALAVRARAALDKATELANGGKDPIPAFEEALGLAEEISQKNPGDAENWVTLIQTRLKLGQHLARLQKNPKTLVDAMEQDRASLLRVNRRVGTIQGGALAHGLYLVSLFEVAKGKDTRLDLDRAIGLARASSRLDPENVAVMNWLATVLAGRGEAETRFRGDPNRWIREALDLWQRVLDRQPKQFAAAVNAAVQAQVLGAWQVQRGLDPIPDFHRAYRFLELAAATNPSHPAIAQVEAQTATQHGIWEVSALRGNGKVQFERAEAALAKVSNPALIRNQQIYLANMRCEAALLIGEDPSPWLNRLESLSGAAKDPQATAGLARGHVIVALHKVLKGQNPIPDLDKAEPIIQETLRNSPLEPGGLGAKIYAQFLHAHLAKIQGASSHTALAQAEEAIRILRQTDPKASILDLWEPALGFVRGRLEGHEDREAGRELQRLATTRKWPWARWILKDLGPRLGVK